MQLFPDMPELLSREDDVVYTPPETAGIAERTLPAARVDFIVICIFADTGLTQSADMPILCLSDASDD